MKEVVFMNRYAGYDCFVCGKKFTPDDDVVVCAECGTPYHRICYQQQNHCINQELHASGGNWKEIEDKQRLENGGGICEHCGHVNREKLAECEACGKFQVNMDDDPNGKRIIQTPLGEQHAFMSSDPYCGLEKDTEIGGERLEDIVSFISNNSVYYVTLFNHFQKTNRKISFNLPCILFPHLYFAHRKMWFMAILVCLLWIIFSLPDRMINMLSVFQDSEYLQILYQFGVNQQEITGITDFLTNNQALFESLQIPFFVLRVISQILLCLFGNYLYFRYVLKHVKEIRHRTSSAPKEVKKIVLLAEGGTNLWNVIGCFFLYQILLGLISGLVLIL